MRAPRGLCVWTSLVCCGVILLGALTWLTRSLLEAERERAGAEARADLQERIRLSLWRMDAMGASLIVEENRHPTDEDVPPESPVRLRFEMAGNGLLTARQGDPTPLRRLLADDEPSSQAIFRAHCMAATAQEPLADSVADNSEVQDSGARYSAVGQEKFNKAEWATRGKSVASVLKNGNLEQTEKAPAPSPATSAVGRVEVSPFTAAWIGGELFLLRRVTSPGYRGLQGVWLDAAEIGRLLTREAADLLPVATLSPAAPGKEIDDGLLLASFPLKLQPGQVPEPVTRLRPAIAFSLASGWIAAGLALATAMLLMRGVMRLSERRASFVSAVTHELRTPLTTFRLYSDMLESGVVREDRRGEYLRVLSREADRLAHLVENVLAFSRIERGSARAVVQAAALVDLLEPMRDRLAARLESAGLRLEMELAGPAAQRVVKVDAAAVEHILFNLIDNAAKYAVGAEPPVVSLTVEPAGIRVRDHGPGIAHGERRRIFRAFHKSARDAAESQPGVGLGLALSRRLARSQGGDLKLEDAPGAGAAFLLELP